MVTGRELPAPSPTRHAKVPPTRARDPRPPAGAVGGDRDVGVGVLEWRPEVRNDLRSAAGAWRLALAGGLPACWWRGPRADSGSRRRGRSRSRGVPELLVADDASPRVVLALSVCHRGRLLVPLRRRRGWPPCSRCAGRRPHRGRRWQVGELLGDGPSEAQLADVVAGTTSLTLSRRRRCRSRRHALLATGRRPLQARDGLERTEPEAPATTPAEEQSPSCGSRDGETAAAAPAPPRAYAAG